MSTLMDFLSELDEKKSLEMISQAYSQKSVIFIKSDASLSIVKARIQSVVDRKVILITEPADADLGIDNEASLKFNVGSEIFFVKTVIKRYMNMYYFDFNVKVVQLRRRREPRYQIPPKWPQKACVIDTKPDVRTVDAIVQDISFSGIRLLILDRKIAIASGQIIKIQFQIYKRAEIICDAIARFTMKKPDGLVTGCDYLTLKPVQQEKVSSLIEDLIQYAALNKI